LRDNHFLPFCAGEASDIFESSLLLFLFSGDLKALKILISDVDGSRIDMQPLTWF